MASQIDYERNAPKSISISERRHRFYSTKMNRRADIVMREWLKSLKPKEKKEVERTLSD